MANQFLEKVKTVTNNALLAGTLVPINTDVTTIPSGGIEFTIRILSSLQRKEEYKAQLEMKNSHRVNPFLPYDPTLYVDELSDTHICLLNKFNAVDYHLLMVTKQFEDQEELLNYNDFHALWTVLKEIDGLGFYNAGKAAGASQRHKHLQLIPCENQTIPVEKIIEKSQTSEILEALPYRHAFKTIPEKFFNNSQAAAQLTLELYREMIDTTLESNQPYNLLVTRRWILLVPRSCEAWSDISVNALGFAGSLLVKNENQLKKITDFGPINVLKYTGI